MTKKCIFRTLFFTVASCMGMSNHVQAETVDYGSLQSLFGEPVTTSATGTPQRASDVAANMTIITADDIRRSGLRNIPQIIGEYVPGIDIFQSGVNSFDVGVRGYQQPFQPRLLVLLDGRQVFIDDYSRTVWSNIPVNIDDIRQIEVVKGAASALFGSNASGGVINIITYSPVYDNNKVAAAGIGTQNQRFADATVTARFADSAGGIKISGGGFDSHEFGTDSNSLDSQLNPLHAYVVENSVFQARPGLQFSTEATYSRSKENTQQPDLFAESAQTDSSYSVRGGFSLQSDYGLITNDNYLNHSDVAPTVDGVTYTSDVDLFVSQLQDQFKIGSHNTFRLALEYRHKYYDEVDAPQALPQTPKTDNNVYATSGSWLWQISDKLSWTNALRAEHQDSQQTGQLYAGDFYNDASYSHIINDLSANSGLVYKATDMDTLRATYGRGVQLPSFIEGSDMVLALLAPNTYDDVEGNPYLKPTVVQNYELDYERQVPKINSTVKLAAFYQMNQDIIGYLADTRTRIVGGQTFIFLQSANVGNSQGFGGEAELKGSNSLGFRWDASYSYSRDVDSSGVAQFLGYNGSTPAHHLRLNGGYTTGPWEFDASGQVVSSSYMLERLSPTDPLTNGSTGGYFTLGSRIGYNINDNFTLALSGMNLTRADTQESPFPAVERQVLMMLTGHF